MTNLFNNGTIFGSKVHIRVQQRNARQKLTTVSGLSMGEPELKALVKSLRKKLCCTGNITEDGSLKFAGDQRQEIARYLTVKQLVEPDNIVIHGF